MPKMNSDWMHDGRWGVFNHWGPPGKMAEEKNAGVDAFDVERLAGQLAEVGAAWYFITLCGSYSFVPNETYEKLLDCEESYCSQRDLVSDIADALAPHGIRLMLYYPFQGLARNPYHAKKFRYISGMTLDWMHEGQQDRQGRLCLDYIRNWEAVMRDYSLRFGKKVHGWWIDGCYWPEQMFRHDDAGYRTMAEALRAGNPESLVAFNGGLETPVIPHSEYEDYTCGEIGHLLPVANRRLDGGLVPLGRFIDGIQYHILTHLGTHWGRTPARFPTELVVGYTKLLNARDCVITWEVAVDDVGHLQADHFEQLRALGAATR